MKTIRFTANATGMLFLIGGAEDRRGDRQVLTKLFEVSQAKSISVVPAASEYPGELADAYYDAFRKTGFSDIFIADIRSRADADRQQHLESISKSDVIFFTGGDQVRLVELLGHSRVMDLVFKKFREGAVIAGTSAGAAAACDPMIFDGDRRGLVKGSVGHSEGFGFISGITFDTHFNARSRLLRLSQHLAGGLSTRGIGLAEDTALIIRPDMTAEVYGSGTIVTVNASRLRHNNYEEINEGENINLTGILVGFLHSGSVFHLGRWQLQNTSVTNAV